MIWEDDANTSYRKGEKIRIDLYAKSTDGGADRLVKSQEVTPIEKTVYILSIMLGWTIVNKVDRRREKNQKSSSN